MSTPEADDQSRTAPIELPSPVPPPPTRAVESDEAHSPQPADRVSHVESVSDVDSHQPSAATWSQSPPEVMVARPVVREQQDVMFVPLAVNIGDGFKFGCGFFLALVVAMLIGFVLVAALFVLTTLFGLNLPISR